MDAVGFQDIMPFLQQLFPVVEGDPGGKGFVSTDQVPDLFLRT